MKNIFILLLVLSVFSCEKQKSTIDTLETEDSIILKKGKNGLERRSVVESNVSNLNLCDDACLFDVHEIVNTSAWYAAGPDEPGYIDYELEEAFHCATCFSGCTVRPAGPNISRPIVEFRLTDPGRFDIDPVLGDIVVYDYLSSFISPSVAEEIKEHFACEIRNFQDNYYSGYFSFVYDIDFFCDSLLCCDSGQYRYLIARVTFSLH